MQKRKFEYEVDSNGCFVCKSHGSNKQRTYPQANHNGKTQSVARHIYESCYGDIPKGLHLRHKCDTYYCINPEHLELGTNADNQRDKKERGRVFRAYGEINGHNKLTTETVLEIRKLKGSDTQQKVANLFGVARETIRDIWSGKRWGHLAEGG